LSKNRKNVKLFAEFYYKLGKNFVNYWYWSIF